MRQEGWLDENGEVSSARIMASLKRRGPAPAYRQPTETPQQMAARLRGGR
jgi:hypothetical protein